MMDIADLEFDRVMSINLNSALTKSV
jgi:hypothetical protein